MKLDDITLTVKQIIKQDEFFKNIRVINAFPNVMKTTRLDAVTIAIGVNSVDIESDQIESYSRSGNISVFADIFLPTSHKVNELESIFASLCRCFNCFNIISIRAGRTGFDPYAQAYLMKTVFTFNDEIKFGSDE